MLQNADLKSGFYGAGGGNDKDMYRKTRMVLQSGSLSLNSLCFGKFQSGTSVTGPENLDGRQQGSCIFSAG